MGHRGFSRGRAKPLRGFTLIELMLIVAIIGLLAAIALPKFANLVVKAKEAALKGQLGAIRSALSIYYCDTEGLLPKHPSVQSVLTSGGKYLEEFPIPEIPAGNHQRPASVGQSVKYEALGSLITDDNIGNANGWFYTNQRTMLVHCLHTDTRSTTWSRW
jgi:prepilin-type N-terminal cleavage/methylation domain-containing protein